jgi:peptidoglycan/LPS O-acetylase OafA/YrhL
MEQLQTFYRSFISFEFPLVIIFPLLALLLLVGVKVSKRKEWQDNPFSLETSKAVQGFAAVSIILHHLSQELAEKAGVLGDFEDLGVLFVGIFFFFSGYGLYTSLKTKDNYLKRRFLSNFVSASYIAVLVFCCLLSIFFYRTFLPKCSITDISQSLIIVCS